MAVSWTLAAVLALWYGRGRRPSPGSLRMFIWAEAAVCVLRIYTAVAAAVADGTSETHGSTGNGTHSGTRNGTNGSNGRRNGSNSTGPVVTTVPASYLLFDDPVEGGLQVARWIAIACCCGLAVAVTILHARSELGEMELNAWVYLRHPPPPSSRRRRRIAAASSKGGSGGARGGERGDGPGGGHGSGSGGVSGESSGSGGESDSDSDGESDGSGEGNNPSPFSSSSSSCHCFSCGGRRGRRLVVPRLARVSWLEKYRIFGGMCGFLFHSASKVWFTVLYGELINAIFDGDGPEASRILACMFAASVVMGLFDAFGALLLEIASASIAASLQRHTFGAMVRSRAMRGRWGGENGERWERTERTERERRENRERDMREFIDRDQTERKHTDSPLGDCDANTAEMKRCEEI